MAFQRVVALPLGACKLVVSQLEAYRLVASQLVVVLPPGVCTPVVSPLEAYKLVVFRQEAWRLVVVFQLAVGRKMVACSQAKAGVVIATTPSRKSRKCKEDMFEAVVVRTSESAMHIYKRNKGALSVEGLLI